MDLLNSYFKNLIFTKIEEKENHMLYGAGIASGLAGGKKRYVLLFVPKQFAIPHKARIHELKWQNLQTRELQYSYNLKNQSWKLGRELQDIILEVQDRNKKFSTYASTNGNFPFEVLLLNNPKKKTIYQYRNKLTLTAAVEIFNTLFNYTGEYAHSIPQFNSGTSSISNWFNPPPSSHNNIRDSEEQDDSFELV